MLLSGVRACMQAQHVLPRLLKQAVAMQVKVRQEGRTAGTTDGYYNHTSVKKRFRSKVEVARHLGLAEEAPKKTKKSKMSTADGEETPKKKAPVGEKNHSNSAPGDAIRKPGHPEDYPASAPPPGGDKRRSMPSHSDATRDGSYKSDHRASAPSKGHPDKHIRPSATGGTLDKRGLLEDRQKLTAAKGGEKKFRMLEHRPSSAPADADERVHRISATGNASTVPTPRIVEDRVAEPSAGSLKRPMKPPSGGASTMQRTSEDGSVAYSQGREFKRPKTGTSSGALPQRKEQQRAVPPPTEDRNTFIPTHASGSSAAERHKTAPDRAAMGADSRPRTSAAGVNTPRISELRHNEDWSVMPTNLKQTLQGTQIQHIFLMFLASCCSDTCRHRNCELLMHPP